MSVPRGLSAADEVMAAASQAAGAPVTVKLWLLEGGGCGCQVDVHPGAPSRTQRVVVERAVTPAAAFHQACTRLQAINQDAT